MVRWLRQSTAVDIPWGPFVDQTDGFTAETALTLTQPDIRLKKNGGNWAQKNASQTLSHEENGWYELSLDTTDTNTLGWLTIHTIESGALPVWEHFMVVPAQVWDSYLASDVLQVDILQHLGGTPNALISGRFDASVGAMANDVVTAAAIAANAIGAAEIADGAIDAATFAANAIDANALAASAVSEIQSGLSTLTLSQIQTMVIEGSLTLEQIMRVLLAATAGKSHSPAAGQRAYRDRADTKNRILANVSGGDRTTVTLDVT